MEKGKEAEKNKAGNYTDYQDIDCSLKFCCNILY